MTHNCSSLNANSEKKAKRHAFAEEMIKKYMKKPTNDGKSNDKSFEKNETLSTITSSNNSCGSDSTTKKKNNKMVELMVMKSKAQVFIYIYIYIKYLGKKSFFIYNIEKMLNDNKCLG